MSTSVSEAFDRASRRVRENLPREHGFEAAARIEGEVPAWLDATLYRNGPALTERFGMAYGHSFEGDGAITAVRVAGGEAEFATKLVRTDEFMEEERSQKMLYGMSVPWLRRMSNVVRGKSKIPANVNVMMWQDKLLAVPEGGAPWHLDADTLDTVGALEMDGLRSGYHSAHPHRIDSRDASFSFRILWGKSTQLSLLVYPDEGPARELAKIEIDGVVYFHDFIATDDHLIFFIPPVRVDIFRAIFRVGPFRKLFKWQPELGTRILVVPIDQPDKPVEIHTDALYVWHFANAFTRGDEICVDFSYWPDFSSFDAVGDPNYKITSQPSLRRARIDVAKRTCEIDVLSDMTSEFPSVPVYEQGLTSVNLFSQSDTEHESGILYCNATTLESRRFLFGAGQLASEPNLITPRGSTDLEEAIVSTLVYDLEAHSSFLALFNAAHIEDGPIAKIWSQHHIPMTFHGGWYAP